MTYLIRVPSPSDSKGIIFKVERVKNIKFYKQALIFKFPYSIFWKKVRVQYVLAEY